MVGTHKFLTRAKGTILMYGMIEQEHVQIAITIVIQKSSLGAKAGEVKSVGCSFINKNGHPFFIHALVNEQLVFAAQDLIITYPANINIQESIVINVYYRDSGRPASILRNGSWFCYVLKL